MFEWIVGGLFVLFFLAWLSMSARSMFALNIGNDDALYGEQCLPGDGAALEPAVPTEVVYAKAGDSASIPFVVPKAVCDAVRSGEQPAFVFIAGLGLAERN